MKSKRAIKIILLCIVCVMFLSPAPSVAQSGAVYQPIEIEFNSEHRPPPVNAFDYTKVRLMVDLEGPKGQRQSVPGFWDGGRK